MREYKSTEMNILKSRVLTISGKYPIVEKSLALQCRHVAIIGSATPGGWVAHQLIQGTGEAGVEDREGVGALD